MNKISSCFCIVLIAFAIMLQSCSSVNRAEKGTALGAAAGGAIGALIGKKGGNPAIGATIGAALGGSTGAFIAARLSPRADTTARAPKPIYAGKSADKEGKQAFIIAAPVGTETTKLNAQLLADSSAVERAGANTLLK